MFTNPFGRAWLISHSPGLRVPEGDLTLEGVLAELAACSRFGCRVLLCHAAGSALEKLDRTLAEEAGQAVPVASAALLAKASSVLQALAQLRKNPHPRLHTALEKQELAPAGDLARLVREAQQRKLFYWENR